MKNLGWWAVTVVLVVLCGVLVISVLAVGSQLDDERAERQDLEFQVDELTAEKADLEAQLEDMQQQAGAAAPVPAPTNVGASEAAVAPAEPPTPAAPETATP